MANFFVFIKKSFQLYVVGASTFCSKLYLPSAVVLLFSSCWTSQYLPFVIRLSLMLVIFFSIIINVSY